MTDNMIGWEQDSDGVVVLTMDDPNQGANTMNDLYTTSMAATVDRLEAEKDGITGVIITSAKKTFFAGGDLKDMTSDRSGIDKVELATQISNHTNGIKAVLRRLETLGKPVVAAINGAALGGGLEIALHTHYRIAADVKGLQIGLPEATLGLSARRRWRHSYRASARYPERSDERPVAGQPFQRCQGQGHRSDRRGRLLDRRARAGRQGLDRRQSRSRTAVGQEGLHGSPAAHRRARPWRSCCRPSRRCSVSRLKGAPMPAPRAIMAAAVEGAYVDVDTADIIETRYFVSLVTGQVAQNMIKAFFFDLNYINGGGSRPEGFEKFTAKKVGVIGAGMMGAAIAYVSAKAGIEVVLKDINIEAAEKGKAYSVKLEEKALSRGKTTKEKSDALLARITPTTDAADFKGVDLVIEAAFESVEVKKQVFGEIEDIVEPDAVLGSNTSTLPITILAEGVKRSEDFIGIHFFSPVDKMPLVEIIKGAKTSDAVLAKVIDYTLQIRKTPIVVNDSRGFFTSRVIGTFVNEAIAAVGEGVDPVFIEQAGSQAGYPAPPLQLMDELTLHAPAEDPQGDREGARKRGQAAPRARLFCRGRQDGRRARVVRVVPAARASTSTTRTASASASGRACVNRSTRARRRSRSRT